MGSLGQAILWEVTTGRERRALRNPIPIESVAFSPDSRVLAASAIHLVTLYDLRSGRELATLHGHKLGIPTLAFAPDGKVLATGSGDNTVKLWSIASGQEVATLREHTDGLLSLAFSPDGRTLATGSRDTTVRLWRAATFQETDPSHQVGPGAGHGIKRLQ